MSVQTVIPPEEIPWYNIANYIDSWRAYGNRALDIFEQNLNEELNRLQRARAQAGPTAPSKPPDKSPSSINPWVDFITQIVAYGLVFWGLMVAANALNPFNFGTALAMLALTVILGGVIVRPLSGAIRYIFGAIVQILQDLVEFVGQWFNAIIQYFEGDFLKAILRIVLLAAFMWLWQFAQTIPVIKNIIDFVSQGIAQVVKWVNDAFDAVTRFLEGLRRYVDDGIANIFQGMGELGRSLSSLFQSQVDRLFTGLESRIQTLRFEILSHVDLINLALSAQITVLGVTVRVLPESARVYFRQFYQRHPRTAVLEGSELFASTVPGGGTVNLDDVAPWTLLGELLDDLDGIHAGTPHLAQDRLDEVRQDIQAMHSGVLPVLGTVGVSVPSESAPPVVVPPIPELAVRPSFVPADDWFQVLGVSQSNVPVAYLIAAIGQHETAWGRTGRGPDGYILGVGVLPDTTLTQYQGLPAQLAWTAPKLLALFGDGRVTYDRILTYATTVQKPGDPAGWASDVFAIYVEIAGQVPVLA